VKENKYLVSLSYPSKPFVKFHIVAYNKGSK